MLFIGSIFVQCHTCEFSSSQVPQINFIGLCCLGSKLTLSLDLINKTKLNRQEKRLTGEMITLMSGKIHECADKFNLSLKPLHYNSILKQ